MSLILDALKKLDREKAFIRKVTANIADEILKTDPSHSEKKFWLHFAAVVFAAIAAAAITYGAVAGFSSLWKTPPSVPSDSSKLNPQVQSAPMPLEPAKEKPDGISRVSPQTLNDTEGKKTSVRESQPVPTVTAAKPASQQVDSTPAAQKPKREAPSAVPRPPSNDRESAGIQKPQDSAPAASAAPLGQPRRRVEPAPPAREIQRETQEKPRRAVPKAQTYAEAPKPSPAPAEKKSDRTAIHEEAKTVAEGEKTAPAAAVSESGSTTPLLRLTGIVWSETPSERCAVINGAIISEGASVQGVKVEEIFPNRVRLSHEGRFFEIRLF